MPYLVIWTNTARQGLEAAYTFLAEKDDEAAIAAIKSIREKVLLLSQFPNAGRPAVDLEPEHRELVIPFGSTGYVLLYRYADNENTISILAIRHQKDVGY